MQNNSIGRTLIGRPQMQLDPCQSQALDAVENQVRKTSYPYYSKVKFYADQVGAQAGPFTYTIPQGHEVRAFAYAVGEDRRIAGYTQADGNATIADTNLSTKNQTIGGQNVIVSGIALQLLPSAFHLSEGESTPHRIRKAPWELIAALWNTVSVEVLMNGGDNVYKLGILGMVPGAGGLIGGAPSVLNQQMMAGMAQDFPFAANGWPVKNCFFRLPEGLIWRNQSNADSMFNLRFLVTRAIRLFSGGDPENTIRGGLNTPPDNDPESVATGTPGYVFPSEIAVEIMAFLVGEVVGPRTRTA
jgi:hypothetical protein